MVIQSIWYMMLNQLPTSQIQMQNTAAHNWVVKQQTASLQ